MPVCLFVCPVCVYACLTPGHIGLDVGLITDDLPACAEGEYPRHHVIQQDPQLPDGGWNSLVGTMEVPFGRDILSGT